MQSPGEQDFEILDEQPLHSGFMKLVRLTLRHRLFRGGWSPPLQRELLERRDAVGVLLYDPARDQVVLVEQFRPGAARRPGSPWLLEIIAGMVEEGEAPEQVARRESEEEADCRVEALMPICRYYCSPGGSSEYFHLFLGRVDAGGAGGVHGLADEYEDIRVLPLPLGEALARLERGEIRNALAIISLQWLALHRERVRAEWA